MAPRWWGRFSQQCEGRDCLTCPLANRSGPTLANCCRSWPACRATPPTVTWPASGTAAPTRTAGRRPGPATSLAGLCEVVPYAHDLAWAGDSTFIPKSGRKLSGTGWHWHGGEGWVAWGQQFELLSVLDLDEHCSYPVHGCLQPAAPRSRRQARRSRPPRAEVAAMLDLLDGTLAVGRRSDIDIFVGDVHYACEPMVAGLDARDHGLVSKLRRDAALWVPWTEPPTGRPGRPRKYAGRFDRARIGELPDEGKRLYHTQLYDKPFKKLLRVVLRPGRGRGSRGGGQADHSVRHRPGDGAGTDLPHLPRPLPNRVQLPRRQASARGWPPARLVLPPATTSTSTPCWPPWPGPGRAVPRANAKSVSEQCRGQDPRSASDLPVREQRPALA